MHRASIALLLSLLLSISTHAQKFQIGIQAGVGICGLSGHFVDTMVLPGEPPPHYSGRPAYTGGLVASLGFLGHYHIQSGLSLSSYSVERPLIGGKEITNLLYMQVPLNIVFTWRQDRGFFCGFGGYYRYALSGHYITTGQGAGSQGKARIPFDTPHHFIRRDAGANAIILGWRFRIGLQVTATQSFSFTNITTIPQSRFFSNTSTVTIGYLLP